MTGEYVLEYLMFDNYFSMFQINLTEQFSNAFIVNGCGYNKLT